MSVIDTLITVFALIAVFLFAIKKFSHQMEYVAGEAFKQKVRLLTQTPFRGTIIGTIVTTILQSSTATTVMAVGLVDAGVLSFYNSLGVIFGANIGSAITTQVFALNISVIAPYIIVIGFILLMSNTRLKKYAKLVFYFGLMLQCLSFISQVVIPLESNVKVGEFFTLLSDGYTALLIGFLFAFVFQSSTVTSGIAVLLAAKGFIGLYEAMYIIFGANIGTTSTAIFSAFHMERTAKKTAMAHVMFNVLGVLVMLPILRPFFALVEIIGGSLSQQIVNAHIIFNIISAVLALIFVHQFADIVEKLTPKKAEVIVNK